MEMIELADGWLTNQIQKVRQEVQDWPQEVKLLRNINATLVQSDSAVVQQDAKVLEPSTCPSTSSKQ